VNTVLIVDDDADIARFVEINLRLEGFDVRIAGDSVEAMAAIRESMPDLVLLDVMMPGVDGVELTRQLRSDPITSNMPVILLTAKDRSADKVVGLTAGADDYIVKPFDTLEMVARVRSTLRRNAEMRSVSPLTGLPGNYRIEQEIARRLATSEDFAVCHVDLDNFKAFNDAYGFLRGDDVIMLLASVLQRVAGTTDRPVPFVGHIGGDDFVVLSYPEQAEPVCERILVDFDASVMALHDADDVAQGHLEVRDRQGIVRRYPLVSVSIGIAMAGRRRFEDHREIVAVAAEMKTVAKATSGSAIAVDRRVDPASAE
jgi:diguanylate cyclase (GGDEF)-like protein